MATVIDLPCPNCERVLKVPESVFGKKIKCKHCGEPFEVERIDLDDLDDDPKPKKKKKPAEDKPAVKPSKPGGAVKAKKEGEPKKEEPKPAAAPYKFQDDDDDDEGAKPTPLGTVDEGEEIPRCPFCAKELDPPDAKVCLHCGFNNVTRVKADSKKVWAPDSSDWMNHLGPGILAAVGAILLLVLNIVVYANMRDWMTDTFLQKEEKDAQETEPFPG